MGWPVARISDIAEVVSGGTPKSGVSEYWDGGIEWITPKDMGRARELYVSTTERNISKTGLEQSSAKLIPENSVILSTRAPIGHLVINAVPMAFNQGCRGLIPNAKINTKFLYYFLHANVELLNSLGTGATFKELSKKVLEEVQLPLPQVEEQKRIVAILDQAFVDIDQARALTKQNLKNARELFESKKLELFDNLGSTSGLQTLPDVCDEIFAGGDAPDKGLYSKERTDKFNIPIYANAVKNNGLYGYTDFSRANKPSITIAARGSGTGHIELREEPFLPIVRLIVLTPKEDIVSLEYLKHALQTLDILRSGSAIPQLTVPMIKEYSIPIPDFDVQQKIVYELRELDALIERVISRYLHKVVLLEELQKSLLQKAFSGELSKDDNEAAA